MASENPKYHDILTRLADGGVEAVVVGMVPAVLQGVPMMTWDLALREVLAVKRRAGRPKDLAAIPYIESTLDEIERKR